ncbi:cytochrome P450 [Polyangium sp. y55x31]|uniref:cytochrome P450 n=1 Tax=Polyangium sp. y55x31 TaxID=3042688 RepID=UPI002482ABB9|nr:cytochrome P450 [Polyangium sp. y55x31]MDI1483794.1 cytochrome P450 [Polyangium sp. y55x31]
MLDLFTDDVRRNPFSLYAEMRAKAPVLHVPLLDLWMLFDYDSVKRALHEHDTWSSVVTTQTGPTPDWLVFSDPPRHTKLRNIIQRAFTPRSIANLEPRIRELSRELLDGVIERGEMDLVKDYAEPLPTMVIAEMIGIPVADRPRFVRWSEIILNLSYTISGGEAAARAVAEHAALKEEMRAYVGDLCAARKKAPKDDLLTRLVEAEVDGDRLTGEEILGFFQLLLVAGTETTTNLLGNTILSFFEHPAELARLEGDPTRFLPTTIEEVLRYRSPVSMVFRATKRDVVMHGKTIPAGKFVLVLLGAANRDPKQFYEPDTFDVGRDPNPHIAFGHGIHFCLGASLSRLEAKVAIPDLLSRLRGLAPASDAPWQPRKALHVHGPASLRVRFAPDEPLAVAI